MALLLDYSYPMAFNGSGFGSSIELLGFGLNQTVVLHVGAPGFNQSSGAVARVSLNTGRWTDRDPLAVVERLLAVESMEGEGGHMARLPDGVGPGCRMGTSLTTTARVGDALDEQEVYLMMASPGCLGRGLVQVRANTTLLSAGPSWMRRSGGVLVGGAACSAAAAACQSMRESTVATNISRNLSSNSTSYELSASSAAELGIMTSAASSV